MLIIQLLGRAFIVSRILNDSNKKMQRKNQSLPVVVTGRLVFISGRFCRAVGST